MISALFDHWPDWPTPQLGQHWQLGQRQETQDYLLMGGDVRIRLSAEECQALRQFNGTTTLGAIAQRCAPQDPHFIPRLLQKLIDHEVLSLADAEPVQDRKAAPASPFNPGVEWRYNPDGYWILRNPTDKTYMQASEAHKQVMDGLGRRPLAQLLLQAGISKSEFQGFYQQMAATGMLEGTEPRKPPRGKFNPLQLLFIRMPLVNPDRWLQGVAPWLAWVWTRPFCWGLLVFLTVSVVMGVYQGAAIAYQGQQSMAVYGASLWLPFALVTVMVVILHELGHALTLKHYQGVVPEIGVLWMCLFPAAYTDTSDSYCLKRIQRIWVVAAGLMVQIAIAAIAFWVWRFAAQGSWLSTASIMAMMAGLLTVALNLNPLARFDGYYLAVAVTGINNLRSRSFLLYKCWLQGQPTPEDPEDIPFLAFYAPFSLLYIWFVFGFLIWRLVDWTLLNAPMTVLSLIVLWLIYYVWPSD
jgi:putative peptide zinc metalloprotease protein